MPITFNTIVQEAGLSLGDVRLLRHQDNRAEKGRTPYELWRDDRRGFDLYQSHQRIANRPKLRARYWASFVGVPDNQTLFVGLYHVTYQGLLKCDTSLPHRDGTDKAGSCDVYELTAAEALKEFIGKLFIQWGSATRAWIQRPAKHDKVITELRREFNEPFPGFFDFTASLSRIEKGTLPKGWIDVLRSSRGIYLLTCPKTKEQYVGSASGEGGFWQRWQEHARGRYVDAVRLKSREPSDYQVAVLEVASSAATREEILRNENQWKKKLQSREMGLNGN